MVGAIVCTASIPRDGIKAAERCGKISERGRVDFKIRCHAIITEYVLLSYLNCFIRDTKIVNIMSIRMARYGYDRNES